MSDVFLKDTGRQSSKGNQLKWEQDGTWYKADYTGYEGLSEYIVSSLLSLSTLAPQEFIHYDTEEIQYKRNTFLGCKSENFLTQGEQLITLERLYKNRYSASLYTSIFQMSEVKDRVSYLIDSAASMTGIPNFGQYLCKLLTIDAFFLNEDRHLHNIAVILKPDGTYRVSPIFDQGASLLSDTTQDYPLGADLYELIDSVPSKTVALNFDDQLDAVESLFGTCIKFRFTKKDVVAALEAEPYYPKEIKQRVQQIIFDRIRKYSYLFP